MSKYRHLFFDLDRTLWDMERNARETLAELYDKYNLADRGVHAVGVFIDHYNEYNDLLWDRYRKKKIDKATLRALRFKQTLAHFGVHDQKLADAFDRDYISEAPKKNNLIPGALELLNALHNDFELHIITNGFPEVQHYKLENCGLDKYFKVIVTSEGCGYNKPDVRIFNHAMKKSGAVASNSLMIGDDLHVDIVGARDAAIDQVYFNVNAQTHDEEVTYEIQELSQLVHIVRNTA